MWIVLEERALAFFDFLKIIWFPLYRWFPICLFIWICVHLKLNYALKYYKLQDNGFVKMLYTTIHHKRYTYQNISGNIVNNNDELQWTNEHTSWLKIYLSHFILERVDVGCVWEVSWRRGRTATYWPKVLLTIAALLSHPNWATQPWVTEGPKPSVWISVRHHVPNWLQLEPTQAACGTCLYNCLTSIYFCCFSAIYTGASLDWRLGRGSIYNKKTRRFHNKSFFFIFSLNSFICIQL